MKLANKVALVTGAASGMGKSAAVIFAKEGARVAAVDIDAQQVQQTASEIVSGGGQALALRADVSKSEDVQKMIEETVAHFGALNIIYNNAGIEGESNFLSNMTEEQFDRVIAINLRGVFLGMKYALPHRSRQVAAPLSIKRPSQDWSPLAEAPVIARRKLG